MEDRLLGTGGLVVATAEEVFEERNDAAEQLFKEPHDFVEKALNVHGEISFVLDCTDPRPHRRYLNNDTGRLRKRYMRYGSSLAVLP